MNRKRLAVQRKPLLCHNLILISSIFISCKRHTPHTSFFTTFSVPSYPHAIQRSLLRFHDFRFYLLHIHNTRPAGSRYPFPIPERLKQHTVHITVSYTASIWQPLPKTCFQHTVIRYLPQNLHFCSIFFVGRSMSRTLKLSLCQHNFSVLWNEYGPLQITSRTSENVFRGTTGSPPPVSISLTELFSKLPVQFRLRYLLK